MNLTIDEMASASAASNSRDGSAKSSVTEQISQTVESTSNLLHLMQQSSPSQLYLAKLPKSLLSKTSTIKNTQQVLQHLPQLISSLDAHTEHGLHNVPQLKTVSQLLSNMGSSQLSPVLHPEKDPEAADKLPQDSSVNMSEQWWHIGGNARITWGMYACHYSKNVKTIDTDAMAVDWLPLLPRSLIVCVNCSLSLNCRKSDSSD